MVATLAPGASELSVDFHAPGPASEPAIEPLATGHYAVHAEDHARSCVATGGFDVEE
jgi:hypothetical protein